MKIILTVLVLTLPLVMSAQEFSFQLVIEDAMGDRDTAYYQIDPMCTDTIDTAYGESDLSGMAWDTALDVRFLVQWRNPSTQVSHLCLSSWWGEVNCPYPQVAMVVSTSHWPITVRWDKQLLSSCSSVSISNSQEIFTDALCYFNHVSGNDFVIANMTEVDSVVFHVTTTPSVSDCNDSAMLPEHAGIIFIGFGSTGIDSPSKNAAFSAVPNPADKSIDVQWKVSGHVEVTLLDMTARQVVRRHGHGQGEVLDVSHLPNGLYVLQLLQGEVSTSLRVVVQH